MANRSWRRGVALALAFSAVLSFGAVGVASAASSPAPKEYANCTKLNKVYPHGVGKPKAKDHVSGKSKPVTTFKKSKKLYKLNKKSDRDGDGIACEKA